MFSKLRFGGTQTFTFLTTNLSRHVIGGCLKMQWALWQCLVSLWSRLFRNRRSSQWISWSPASPTLWSGQPTTKCTGPRIPCEMFWHRPFHLISDCISGQRESINIKLAVPRVKSKSNRHHYKLGFSLFTLSIQWNLDIKTTPGTNTMWSLYTGGLYVQVQEHWKCIPLGTCKIWSL